MEWCAPLVLPVSFGIKLNTIHSCWELLLCDQIMDLSCGISHSAARNSEICLHGLYILNRWGEKWHRTYSTSYFLLYLPIGDMCPSPISSLLRHLECNRSSWSPLHCIQDFYHQRTLGVWASMSVLQHRHKLQLPGLVQCSMRHVIIYIVTQQKANGDNIQCQANTFISASACSIAYSVQQVQWTANHKAAEEMCCKHER